MASKALQSLRNEGLRLIRVHATTRDNNNPLSEDLRVQLAHYELDLRQWLCDYDVLMSSNEGYLTDQDESYSNNLRIMHQSIHAWLYAGIMRQSSTPQRVLLDNLPVWARQCIDEGGDNTTLSLGTSTVSRYLFFHAILGVLNHFWCSVI